MHYEDYAKALKEVEAANLLLDSARDRACDLFTSLPYIIMISAQGAELPLRATGYDPKNGYLYARNLPLDGAQYTAQRDTTGTWRVLYVRRDGGKLQSTEGHFDKTYANKALRHFPQ